MMPSLRLLDCAGDEFVVWKKEICALIVEGPDGNDRPITNFMRLEFHEDLECLELDWLEPTIHNGKPALILHCHCI